MVFPAQISWLRNRTIAVALFQLPIRGIIGQARRIRPQHEPRRHINRYQGVSICMVLYIATATTSSFLGALLYAKIGA
ncbi:hypothetical protein BJX61DRAFT_522335 [Aspergillus egyptiacus]|nr:hypothetical protein BJX61DRAFT_522335 [Aspergillus egyptiacus]